MYHCFVGRSIIILFAVRVLGHMPQKQSYAASSIGEDHPLEFILR